MSENSRIYAWGSGEGETPKVAYSVTPAAQPTPLNRYAVFAFMHHDAEGGWGDFDSSFAEAEEATTRARTLDQEYTGVHVIDLRDGSYVSWKMA